MKGGDCPLSRELFAPEESPQAGRARSPGRASSSPPAFLYAGARGRTDAAAPILASMRFPEAGGRWWSGRERGRSARSGRTTEGEEQAEGWGWGGVEESSVEEDPEGDWRRSSRRRRAAEDAGLGEAEQREWVEKQRRQEEGEPPWEIREEQPAWEEPRGLGENGAGRPEAGPANAQPLLARAAPRNEDGRARRGNGEAAGSGGSCGGGSPAVTSRAAATWATRTEWAARAAAR